MKKHTPANPFARFQPADPSTKARLIGLSVGEPGSRKTSFWLEAPAPIVVFSLDMGLEGVVERVLAEQPRKEVYVAEYTWNPTADTLDQGQAQDIRDKFTEDFESACTNARTVIWDKETDVWSLFRYAEFGPEMNDAPRNYPALNQRYRRLLNLPKSLDLNFGLIEGMKDEWSSKINPSTGARGAAATGKRVRAGFGELSGLVHLELLHTGVSPSTWGIQVGKARGPGGHEVAGQSLPNLTFQEFAMLVFPETDEETWR